MHRVPSALNFVAAQAMAGSHDSVKIEDGMEKEVPVLPCGRVIE
jgi:hypothetical protein